MIELDKNLLDRCSYKDYPQKGVNFIDIFPILMQYYPKDFINKYHNAFDNCITFVPEARGFLFYSNLNPKLTIALRKPNKLPGDVLQFSYQKEYGIDSLSFQKQHLINAINNYNQSHSTKVIPVTFFDDILATGGTAKAFIKFIESINVEGYTFKVQSCKFYIILTQLPGYQSLSKHFNVDAVYQI